MNLIDDCWIRVERLDLVSVFQDDVSSLANEHDILKPASK